VSAVIAALLAGLWKPIAAILGALGLYVKGRSDAARNAELNAWRQANEAERQRADIDREVRSGGAADARERLRRYVARPD